MAQEIVNEKHIIQRTKEKEGRGGYCGSSEVYCQSLGTGRVCVYSDRVQYQDRARAAATNDVEIQAGFLRMLAKLVHQKITQGNTWNCGEKGFIENRNNTQVMAIVHKHKDKGDRATALIKTPREF